jgi:hypothetical protein
MDRRHQLAGGVFLGVLLVLGIAQFAIDRTVAAQTRGAVQAPRFEVDFMWPRPLPNHWVLGNAIGVWADERDHIWIVHRGSATLANNEKGLELKSGDCCAAAPPVLEFDADGRLVNQWGGPGQGYDWPDSNHGIFIDHVGNVWIGGNGPGDSHIVKFTRDGKFIAQYGKPAARASGKDKQGNPTFARNSHDMDNFGRVAKIFVDPKANEAYIADGYFNKRVAVIDAATGKMKRYWGAYGNKPDDAVDTGPYDPAAPVAQQFRNPEEHQVVGIGLGRRVLARSPAALSLRRRRHQQPRLHPAARFARAAHELWHRRPAAQPVLWPAQHRDRLEGQHLHNRNVGRQAVAEVRLQGARCGHDHAPGHGVAAQRGTVITAAGGEGLLRR